MPRDASKTREKILDAATHLFYGEGIRAVSVDAVSEKAGITKKTLYYHFKSKDELVAAYLQSQDQPTLALFQRWFDESEGTVADKIRGIFERFAIAADRPRWKGCGFLRTTAELARTPGHPAIRVGAEHKKRFEAWFAEVLAHEGVVEPAPVARKLIVLFDGAATVMLIHRDPEYVLSAGDVAAELVETALGSP